MILPMTAADDDMLDDDGPPPVPPGPGLGLDAPAQPDAPAHAGGVSAGKSAARDDYRVLARKYRPATFSELIGQEALVRTLTNAIEAGRIAQAFMLTGVRGVGKTTTARIVAKALNCIGPDGTGGPTVSPCGVCEHCTAIAGDRHVDVIEMDAASRTGVDDIRELIDGVRYRPVSARYKVYVLDEVHMLSKNAFNALLKTLEEPPEHVKFVFATTEIRKVPVTVLSRCQRFDLRRVPVDQLATHFSKVAEAEGMTVEPDALAMIARAADGSVRDGLSILDQAIALSSGTLEAERVRDMLGLADRNRVWDLFDATMRGDAPEALSLLEELYGVGADPAVVIEDLLDITHFLTRAILVPEALDRPTTAELERTRGREMAEKLSLPILARAWQMLMKGLGEVRAAPAPIQAAEMVLIRLIHVADMPPPADLAAKLKEQMAGGGGGSPAGGGPGGSGGGGAAASALPRPSVIRGGAAAAAPRAEAAPTPDAVARDKPQPADFHAIVALFEAHKEARLATHLKRDVHPVHVEPGRLEFRPGPHAPSGLVGDLGRVLGTLTGRRWVVSVSNEPGEATLAEQAERAEADRRGRAERDPLVQAVRAAFPDIEITRVTGPDVPVDAAPETDGMMLDDAGMAVPVDPDDIDPEDDL
jgi:DNA polymerase-3 subunit gamma/tau